MITSFNVDPYLYCVEARALFPFTIKPHPMKHPRTLILLLLLATSALVTVQAQEIRLGGGYSGSSVDSDASDNWKGQAGYQYGLDVTLGDRFFLKPGIWMQVRNLNFTTVGVGDDGKPTGVVTDTKYTSKALRIPVMAGLRLFDHDNTTDFNMYVFGGPTALIGLSTDTDDNTLSFTTKGTQWYLGLGLGAEFSFIFIDAGYDVGLTNMFDGDGINTNPKVNNFYIDAGLRFVLNK